MVTNLLQYYDLGKIHPSCKWTLTFPVHNLANGKTLKWVKEKANLPTINMCKKKAQKKGKKAKKAKRKNQPKMNKR